MWSLQGRYCYLSLQERKIYELSTADKIKACQEFKLMGNLFFKEGQYFRASEKYRMVPLSPSCPLLCVRDELSVTLHRCWYTMSMPFPTRQRRRLPWTRCDWSAC